MLLRSVMHYFFEILTFMICFRVKQETPESEILKRYNQIELNW